MSETAGAAGTDAERLPVLSRMLWRILDGSRRLDYVAAAAFAGFPLLHAWWVGAHATQGDYAGYWVRANWTVAPVALPFALLALRWMASRIAPVSSGWPPESVPATVQLVAEAGRREAYESLRKAILAPRNLGTVLAVTTLVMVADTWRLVAAYLGLDPQLYPAPDWSILFLLPDSGIGKAANLWLNVSAYSVQFVGILVGITSVVLLLRHNLWFLRRIYQRRWVPAGQEASFIQIDLDDVDHCFGFRKAHAAFNTQVGWLVVGGLVLVIIRSAALGESGSAGDATDPIALVAALLPDFGQWVIAVSWLAAFLMVVLPGFVKFLPQVPVGDNAEAQSSIVGYLREFLPDDRWPGHGGAPSESVVDGLAARFAANAFWPTGNNRAEQLFLFASWVFLLILIPDARVFAGGLGPGWLILLGGFAANAALAWLFTKLAFRVLENALRFVDPRLVEDRRPAAGAPAAPETAEDRIRVNVFVSYRRSDTRAYSGRLHDTLERRIVSPARLFRDLETIQAGVDFVDAIEEALDASDAAIVLIGPQWLTATGGDGSRRIDDPTDFVHREVAGAVARGMFTLPVLVGGASMPSQADLPDALAPLAFRNALEITDSRWDYDVGRLIAALAQLRPRAAR